MYALGQFGEIGGDYLSGKIGEKARFLFGSRLIHADLLVGNRSKQQKLFFIQLLKEKSGLPVTSSAEDCCRGR